MADLESVLADVSYLMAMERSKAPGAKTIRKFTLPDRSVHNVIHKHLEKTGFSFIRIYKERMGIYFLDKFIPERCPLYRAIKAIMMYERLASSEMRRKKAKEIYDGYIYVELLSMNTEALPKQLTDEIRDSLNKDATSPPKNLFNNFRLHLFQELQTKYWNRFVLSEQYVRYCQWKYMELIIPQQISLSDFSIHRIIGRGGFGEVYGCRKDDSGKMFAMKLLDKKRIKLKKGEALALNEKNMLAKVNSPFVVNMYYSFQTTDKLCFILDLMNGGDLHYHLTQHGVFSEDEVRFYAAELILALEHIHSQHIVYRDLKPSNILLDEQGHVRLSDLGLACDYTDHQPSSSVGTHGYMAPEVIKKGVQYTYTADWFSLGCVLYKLLRGHSPFRIQNAKNKEEIDKLTLEKEVVYHPNMSEGIVTVLSGLLQKDPGRRLCCQGRSAEEVKELPFFATLQWEDVHEKKIHPPLVPPRGEVNAADAFDIGNFDDDDTRGIKGVAYGSTLKQDAPLSKRMLIDDDQKVYRRFNTVVSDRWQAEMMEGIFEGVNVETEKRERERKTSHRKTSSGYNPDFNMFGDLVLQGFGQKMGTGLFSKWEKKYFMLYPNRIEWGDNFQSMGKGQSLPFFSPPLLVEEKAMKDFKVIRMQQIGNKKEYIVKFEGDFERDIWLSNILDSIHKSNSMLHSGPRVLKDTVSSSAVTQGRRHAGGTAHALTTAASVPFLLGEK